MKRYSLEALLAMCYGMQRSRERERGAKAMAGSEQGNSTISSYHPLYRDWLMILSKSSIISFWPPVRRLKPSHIRACLLVPHWPGTIGFEAHLKAMRHRLIGYHLRVPDDP